jgi:hypothetical protein
MRMPLATQASSSDRGFVSDPSVTIAVLRLDADRSRQLSEMSALRTTAPEEPPPAVA